MVGIIITSYGYIHANNGMIGNNPIGVNIQVPGFSTLESFEDLVMINNSINYDSIELSVPKIDTQFDELDNLQIK